MITPFTAPNPNPSMRSIGPSTELRADRPAHIAMSFIAI